MRSWEFEDDLEVKVDMGIEMVIEFVFKIEVDLEIQIGSDCCFEGLVLEGFETENVVKIVIRIEIKVDSETQIGSQFVDLKVGFGRILEFGNVGVMCFEVLFERA